MTRQNLMMVSAVLLFGLCPAGALAQSATLEGPEAWFVKDYGALWLDAPWRNTQEILRHYTAQVVVREPGQPPQTVDARAWLGPLLTQWRDEGWISSEITAIRTDALNATTTSFKVRWKDQYADGSSDHSCGWYLADWLDGAWKNSQYATIDCIEHDLD